MTVLQVGPPPDPCPDCGYEGCVCDQPTLPADDLVLVDPDDDQDRWWQERDQGRRP